MTFTSPASDCQLGSRPAPRLVRPCSRADGRVKIRKSETKRRARKREGSCSRRPASAAHKTKEEKGSETIDLTAYGNDDDGQRKEFFFTLPVCSLAAGADDVGLRRSLPFLCLSAFLVLLSRRNRSRSRRRDSGAAPRGARFKPPHCWLLRELTEMRPGWPSEPLADMHLRRPPAKLVALRRRTLGAAELDPTHVRPDGATSSTSEDAVVVDVDITASAMPLLRINCAWLEGDEPRAVRGWFGRRHT